MIRSAAAALVLGALALGCQAEGGSSAAAKRPQHPTATAAATTNTASS
jgi:negative regulator of sigma E activity